MWFIPNSSERHGDRNFILYTYVLVNVNGGGFSGILSIKFSIFVLCQNFFIFAIQEFTFEAVCLQKDAKKAVCLQKDANSIAAFIKSTVYAVASCSWRHQYGSAFGQL